MNHPARKYGFANVKPRRSNFFPGQPHVQPYPHYPHPTAIHQMPNSPSPLNPSHPSDREPMPSMIMRRTRTVINFIFKVIRIVLSKISAQGGASGASPAAIGAVVVTTTALAVVSTGLTIGLGVGLPTNDTIIMNPTLTGNHTYCSPKKSGTTFFALNRVLKLHEINLIRLYSCIREVQYYLFVLMKNS